MIYSGDRDIIELILKRKQTSSFNDQRKIVLIAPGGGQRGVIQGGVGLGLKKAGVVDFIDTYIGISAGAAFCFYTLSGKPEKGTEIYYLDNVRNNFIDFKRFWKVMDIDRLEKVFRSDEPVSIKNLLAARPDFFTVVTDQKTGQGLMLNVKDYPDPIACLVASICVPILSHKSVQLNGRDYVDGFIGNPLPITLAVKSLEATDILIVMNEPIKFKTLNPVVNYLARIVGGFPQEFVTYRERYNEALKYLTGEKSLPSGVRIGVISPKETVLTPFTMDENLLKEAALEAEIFTEELFS